MGGAWNSPSYHHLVCVNEARDATWDRRTTKGRRGRKDTMLMASALLLLMLPLPSLDLRGGLFISSCNSLPLSNSDADHSEYTDISGTMSWDCNVHVGGVIGCRAKKILAFFRTSRYSL